MRGLWGAGAGIRRPASLLWLLAAAQLPDVVRGYSLDITSSASIKSTAATMAEDMLSFYHGDEPGNTPGLLPDPYYWWEAGAMLGALVDYWYYTGDTKYNNLTQQGLLFQAGPNKDYMPPNQTLTEGNDDQGFWGMAVMSAAEYNFDNPPATEPQWLALAQAVFNTQAPRWETQDCNGGLRWQIFTWNNGFDYKNSISQACFFNLAARLARYTGNQTYADWAGKTWDWMAAVGLLAHDTYYVYDGASIESNCTQITPYQWTYNAGSMLLGAAAMYNYTTGSEQDLWRERVDGMLNGTEVFFTGTNKDIMTEVACETVDRCDTDEQSFKAYLSRWMAATTKWAPWTFDRVKPLLESSAVAAAAQCTGGSNGRMCGLKWASGKYDGTTGVGQQMAAMEVVLANMISDVTAPVTNNTGGTSTGDPNAGNADAGRTTPEDALDRYKPIRAGDRAGAAILTVLVLLGIVSVLAFMFIDETDNRTPRERWEDLRRLAAEPGALFATTAAAAAAAGDGLGEQEAKSKTSADRTDDSGSNSGSSVTGATSVTGEKAGPRVSRRSLPDGAYTTEHWRRRSMLPAGGLDVSDEGQQRRRSSIMPESHPHSRVRELSRDRLSQLLAEGVDPTSQAGRDRRRSEMPARYGWADDRGMLGVGGLDGEAAAALEGGQQQGQDGKLRKPRPYSYA